MRPQLQARRRAVHGVGTGLWGDARAWRSSAVPARLQDWLASGHSSCRRHWLRWLSIHAQHIVEGSLVVFWRNRSGSRRNAEHVISRHRVAALRRHRSGKRGNRGERGERDGEPVHSEPVHLQGNVASGTDQWLQTFVIIIIRVARERKQGRTSTMPMPPFISSDSCSAIGSPNLEP